jgi:aspartyl-tRNA(Asn)/glutamyl-tRNA(Gln) amidotransferase subunit B
MAWEIVVGIETHAQLLTKSKIFSGASTAFGAPPNSQASAVDIALPGVLPVLNKAAVELAIRFGLAVGGPEVISRRSVFARKNYFYPDLPKGYQISQYEIPVVTGGSLKIVLPEGEKTIRLTRAHLEEDAGKSLHEDFHGMSGIDLNRAGTPLLEIVSEPELRGAKEAVAYARAMHALVRWIGICDGNMQEGSFRCDANVSVRKVGDAKLGTRCEIKNLNSFRFMEEAIEFEARRQIDILEDGGKIVQETRLYDPDKNETRSMRSKEDAQDYRYFPDPDLLPLVISEADIERVHTELPELPDVRRERFETEYKLSAYDSRTLTSDKAMADFFESLVRVVSNDPKLCANWIMGEVAAYLNRNEKFFDDLPITANQLGRLLSRIQDGTVSNKTAKDVFEQMCAKYGMGDAIDSKLGYPRDESIRDANLADQIIETKGFRQISDVAAIEKIVDEVLAANAKQVEDYRSGKEKAFNSLVGQVMKRSQGKANPAQVNEILRRKLKGQATS